jgi:hypothetical protein
MVCITKLFDPWHICTATTNETTHTATFSKWYNDLIATTQRPQIPQSLLNRHTHNIWFRMSHDHMFVRPLGAAPTLFHMNPLPFYLDEVVFNKEVTSWLGVIVKRRSQVSPTQCLPSCNGQLLRNLWCRDQLNKVR